MKYLFLIVLMSVIVPVQASGLVWDDVAKIPAIKVGKDKYQSCNKKGWYIVLNQDENKAKREKEPNLCSSKSSWGAGGDRDSTVELSAQAIADIQLGVGAKAVGMMDNFEKPSYGDTPTMLLFYK
jgi:hypothetical protein